MATEDVQGTGPVSRKDAKMYEQEYKQGAALFQKSLNEYAKSDNMYQKEEYKEVMNQAMQVLNETARGLKRQELLKQNEEIERDYGDYQNNPNDRRIQQKLDQDLEKAKNSITK
ncbi:MAG TPA: hypothetical protein VLF94_03625 [Chlamydiales bacterium]|nr:hypothetical protein [Chlamydiales bacterium]